MSSCVAEKIRTVCGMVVKQTEIDPCRRTVCFFFIKYTHHFFLHLKHDGNMTRTTKTLVMFGPIQAQNLLGLNGPVMTGIKQDINSGLLDEGRVYDPLFNHDLLFTSICLFKELSALHSLPLPCLSVRGNLHVCICT